MLPVLDDFDRAIVEINKSDDELLTKEESWSMRN
jgi:molecular chaperone GrpE